MTWPTPSPETIVTAFRDHGLTPVLWSGWDTRGRPWSDGLRACVDHHVSGVGPGVRDWCSNPGGRYPIVNSHIARPGDDVPDGTLTVFSALSCWGTGLGGPWPGVAAADSLHLVAWSTEMSSWGLVKDFTDKQFETLGRQNAAMVDLGMPAANEINHKDWAPGRKNDTLYDIAFLRANTARYLAGAPVVARRKDESMILIHGRTAYLLSGGRMARVSDVTKAKAQSAGVPVFGVDSADWQALTEAFGAADLV